MKAQNLPSDPMEENYGYNVIIDIENIHNFLTNNPNYRTPNDTNVITRKNLSYIGKAPEQLCQPNRSSYEPIVVSIGPYHHGKESLQFMERRKWRLLEYILATNIRRSLDDYLKVIRELYPLARSYYTSKVNIESNRFVQMILLDGCFFLMASCVMDYIPDSSGFSIVEYDQDGNEIPRQYYFFANDLLLAENQITFIVVMKIHELITGNENTTTLLDEVNDFVVRILCSYPKSIGKPDQPKNFDHLLHLFHMYLKPSQNYDYIANQLNYGYQSLYRWHRASKYNAAGVTFEKRVFDENNTHSLLDVSFTNDVLEIPYFLIDENIINIFKNLIAFEKLNLQIGNDITAYIIFMFELIRGAEDVDLLVSKGIIEHHFQSHEEVVDMLMGLSFGIEFDFASSFYLKPTCQVLGELYNSRLRRWKGWLGRSSSIICDWIINS